MSVSETAKEYIHLLTTQLSEIQNTAIESLGKAILTAHTNGNRIFICGNGGSAANAAHIANDFLYGANPKGKGLRVMALPCNESVVTCLGNDLGYEQIFARQVNDFGEEGDILLVLSGSGNSPNVIAALQTARNRDMATAAILGFDGGRCKQLADIVIHFPIQDMQVSEDMQMIVAHILTRWIRRRLEGQDH